MYLARGPFNFIDSIPVSLRSKVEGELLSPDNSLEFIIGKVFKLFRPQMLALSAGFDH
jgi:hypothetical protein